MFDPFFDPLLFGVCSIIFTVLIGYLFVRICTNILTINGVIFGCDRPNPTRVFNSITRLFDERGPVLTVARV